jgi:hypothetical protein
MGKETACSNYCGLFCLDCVMAHSHGGNAMSPIAGLQLCDRSKITLISTTQPREGGFGK